MDVVWEERRTEFTFEGHRPQDLFRNNRPLIKNYPGFHSLCRFNQTILPTDNRVILSIPYDFNQEEVDDLLNIGAEISRLISNQSA